MNPLGGSINDFCLFGLRRWRSVSCISSFHRKLNAQPATKMMHTPPIKDSNFILPVKFDRPTSECKV